MQISNRAGSRTLDHIVRDIDEAYNEALTGDEKPAMQREGAGLMEELRPQHQGENSADLGRAWATERKRRADELDGKAEERLRKEFEEMLRSPEQGASV